MPPSSPNTQKSPVVVLVVEDEEVIRTLATEFMADTGFEVLEAPDADTAVRLLQTEAERVHVLFTDLRMPGAMDGLMLAHIRAATGRGYVW
jgi:two-component system, response regulator PdtaR